MLNQEYQRAKREKQKQERLKKIAKKQSEMRVTLLQVLEQNAECENAMLKMLGNPNPDSEGVLFGNITLEQLEKTRDCTIA